MKYEKLTKATLINQIKAQERLIEQLLSEQQQNTKIEAGWSGNLGHWYWDIPSNTVTFNPAKVQALGYRVEEVPTPIGYDFFTSKLHPDDYEPTMEKMREHLRGERHVYEVEYRIRTKEGAYKWFYDRGVVTKRGKGGRPLFLSGIVFDITDRKNYETKLEIEKQELQIRSVTDELTQVLNYRGIINEIKRIMTLPESEIEGLSLFMLDIDDFKQINDTHGHLIGDEVLRDFAKVIKTNLRDGDFLGRYAGDEFIVVLGNTALETAREVAERIRLIVSRHEFVKGIRLTFSGGVYELKGATVLDLLRQADVNLYQAKRVGKNTII
ncbi:MAG: diguanylate cyclase [Bacilli bacterium]